MVLRCVSIFMPIGYNFPFDYKLIFYALFKLLKLELQQLIDDMAINFLSPWNIVSMKIYEDNVI